MKATPNTATTQNTLPAIRNDISGKTQRVNKATRKRKVLLEELASIIAKYGDVLAGMSTNDIKQELRRVVNTQPTDEGSADNKVDS